MISNPSPNPLEQRLHQLLADAPGIPPVSGILQATEPQKFIIMFATTDAKPVPVDFNLIALIHQHTDLLVVNRNGSSVTVKVPGELIAEAHRANWHTFAVGDTAIRKSDESEWEVVRVNGDEIDVCRTETVLRHPVGDDLDTLEKEQALTNQHRKHFRKLVVEQPVPAELPLDSERSSDDISITVEERGVLEAAYTLFEQGDSDWQRPEPGWFRHSSSSIPYATLMKLDARGLIESTGRFGFIAFRITAAGCAAIHRDYPQVEEAPEAAVEHVTVPGKPETYVFLFEIGHMVKVPDGAISQIEKRHHDGYGVAWYKLSGHNKYFAEKELAKAPTAEKHEPTSPAEEIGLVPLASEGEETEAPAPFKIGDKVLVEGDDRVGIVDKVGYGATAGKLMVRRLNPNGGWMSHWIALSRIKRTDAPAPENPYANAFSEKVDEPAPEVQPDLTPTDKFQLRAAFNALKLHKDWGGYMSLGAKSANPSVFDKLLALGLLEEGEVQSKIGAPWTGHRITRAGAAAIGETYIDPETGEILVDDDDTDGPYDNGTSPVDDELDPILRPDINDGDALRPAQERSTSPRPGYYTPPQRPQSVILAGQTISVGDEIQLAERTVEVRGFSCRGDRVQLTPVGDLRPDSVSSRWQTTQALADQLGLQTILETEYPEPPVTTLTETPNPLTNDDEAHADIGNPDFEQPQVEPINYDAYNGGLADMALESLANSSIAFDSEPPVDEEDTRLLPGGVRPIDPPQGEVAHEVNLARAMVEFLGGDEDDFDEWVDEQLAVNPQPDKDARINELEQALAAAFSTLGELQARLDEANRQLSEEKRVNAAHHQLAAIMGAADTSDGTWEVKSFYEVSDDLDAQMLNEGWDVRSETIDLAARRRGVVYVRLVDDEDGVEAFANVPSVRVPGLN